MPILKEEKSVYPDDLLDKQPLALDQLNENDRRWWTVHTKSRQEKAFVRQLEGMDISFYLPLVVKDNMIRGRRVRSHIPLFGGYVFLCGSNEERSQAMTTNRVAATLEVDDQIQLVEDLRQIAKLIECKAPLTVESRLSAGDRVRVKNGPMAGLEGTVVDRRGTARLLVAVTMLQQGVSIEIDDFVLEPI